MNEGFSATTAQTTRGKSLLFICLDYELFLNITYYFMWNYTDQVKSSIWGILGSKFSPLLPLTCPQSSQSGPLRQGGWVSIRVMTTSISAIVPFNQFWHWRAAVALIAGGFRSEPALEMTRSSANIFLPPFLKTRELIGPQRHPMLLMKVYCLSYLWEPF